ncbi:hypothetical protein DFH06DRAFT_1297451 [Mycena polygramma]|nr:hypothetical protein DFH06DRAFT_1297451 [Mycena polygramma]
MIHRLKYLGCASCSPTAGCIWMVAADELAHARVLHCSTLQPLAWLRELCRPLVVGSISVRAPPSRIVFLACVHRTAPWLVRHVPLRLGLGRYAAYGAGHRRVVRRADLGHAMMWTHTLTDYGATFTKTSGGRATPGPLGAARDVNGCTVRMERVDSERRGGILGVAMGRRQIQWGVRWRGQRSRVPASMPVTGADADLPMPPRKAGMLRARAAVGRRRLSGPIVVVDGDDALLLAANTCLPQMEPSRDAATVWPTSKLWERKGPIALVHTEIQPKEAAWPSGNQQSWSLSKSEITGPRSGRGFKPGQVAF